MKSSSLILILTFALSALAPAASASAGEREVRKALAPGEAFRFYLRPGHIALLEASEEIIDIRLGNAKDFEVLIQKAKPFELTLFLKRDVPRGLRTNLIIRSRKRIYLVDLIADTQKHFDYVELKGSEK